VNFKRYTGQELHGFMFPDYDATEPRWIDGKNVNVAEVLALVNGLAARDCTHDEPNCGYCLSCRAKTALESNASRDLSSQISVHRSTFKPSGDAK
jgi:hypothetical protein